VKTNLLACFVLLLSPIAQRVVAVEGPVPHHVKKTNCPRRFHRGPTFILTKPLLARHSKSPATPPLPLWIETGDAGPIIRTNLSPASTDAPVLASY